MVTTKRAPRTTEIGALYVATGMRNGMQIQRKCLCSHVKHSLEAGPSLRISFPLLPIPKGGLSSLLSDAWMIPLVLVTSKTDLIPFLPSVHIIMTIISQINITTQSSASTLFPSQLVPPTRRPNSLNPSSPSSQTSSGKSTTPSARTQAPSPCSTSHSTDYTPATPRSTSPPRSPAPSPASSKTGSTSAATNTSPPHRTSTLTNQHPSLPGNVAREKRPQNSPP